MKKRKINYRNLAIVVSGFVIAIALVIYLSTYLIHGVMSWFAPSEDKIQEEVLKTSEENGTIAAEEEYVVFLDAGHGGYDSGGISPDETTLEKEITLEIAQQVGSLLEKEGYTVVYSRTSDDVKWPEDNSLDLSMRASMAASANADVLVSIHLNSIDTMMEETEGTEIWYYDTNPINEQLSTNILEEMMKGTSLADRGIKNADLSPLQLLNEATMPACLVEVGFITNTKDYNYMKSSSGQNAIAKSIANGIMKTLTKQ